MRDEGRETTVETSYLLPIFEILVKNYRKMGSRISVKVYILDAHLEKFKENMAGCSKEEGKPFQQNILDFERRYKGPYNENMTVDR